MALDTTTTPALTAPSRPASAFVTSVCRLLAALPRGIRRPAVAVPRGLLWRARALLWLLLLHAERTGGDAETIRHGYAVVAALGRLHGRARPLRARPLAADPSSRATPEDR